ncbi:MAG: hypothetical protein ACJAV0_000620 [Shewanella sp.]
MYSFAEQKNGSSVTELSIDGYGINKEANNTHISE